jgi:hypothetical protein
MESLARTAAVLVVAAAATAAPLTGTFALLGGTPRVVARAIVSHPRPNDVTLDIVQSTRPGGPPIRAYQSDMTKLMHVIVISDDFRQFVHEHPSFNRKTGTFRQTVTVNPAHSYIIYTDSIVKGAGQQVFRFTIPPAAQPAATTQPLPPSTPSPTTMNDGPYAVKLAKTTLAPGTAQSIDLDITKGGAAASDLQPYLGAAGHAVFINTATLEYVHIHPTVRGASEQSADKGSMDMDEHQSGPVAGPHLMMHVPALPVGTYKLWFQFRGGGSLYVAPFTLAVR